MKCENDPPCDDCLERGWCDSENEAFRGLEAVFEEAEDIASEIASLSPPNSSE